MIVVIAALFFGLLLLAILSRFAHNVPRIDARAGSERDPRPPIPAAEFERTLRTLLPALGLEILSAATDADGTLELICRDPRPVTGGKILVRARRGTAGGGQVDAAEVLAFAESVRADTGALKGIDIAVAGFTDEAYAARGATPAFIELIDGAKLDDLVRTYAPLLVPELERYRALDTGGRRHSRAAGSSGVPSDHGILTG
jgi:Restriction endonuclease